METTDLRWHVGVRSHAINALIADTYDPDRILDEDESDVYAMLDNAGHGDDVYQLMEQAYELGFRMARYDSRDQS